MTARIGVERVRTFKRNACALSSGFCNWEFWQTKFSQNIVRDHTIEERLAAAGWSVVVVWECETTKKRLPDLEARLRRLFIGDKADAANAEGGTER
jgi:G:T-mismatch repair DNA endonuclease (very short patch repair protein)